MKKASLFLVSALMLGSCAQDNCSDEKMQLQQRVTVLEDSLKMMRAGGQAEAPKANDMPEENTSGASGKTSENQNAASTGAAPTTATAKPKIVRTYYRDGSRTSGGRSAKGTPGWFPEGSDRPLTSNDLKSLSDWGMKVIENEIYARHGMIFTDTELRDHFAEQTWYHRRARNVSGSLTSTERENLSTIEAFKSQKKS